MVFRVIEGGLSAAAPVEQLRAFPSREDVEREAARRLRAINYESLARRESVAGIPMPREIKYLGMQIGFAAQAIASLARIPDDFCLDAYWPAPEERTALRTRP
jgi:hypothetical protein